MKKRKGQYAEKSRLFRERKAAQGKKCLRVWVTPDEASLVRWALSPAVAKKLFQIAGIPVSASAPEESSPSKGG